MVKSRLLSIAALIVGLLTALLLIAFNDFAGIFELLVEGGWQLLWVPLAWLPCLPLALLGWRLLFPIGQAPGWPHHLVALWMGRAVNTLLPVAHMGGELVKARLAARWGSPPAVALASVVVDKTNQALALLSWGLIGCLLLLLLPLERQLIWPAMAGLLLLGTGILGFILVQRAGLFRRLGTLADRLGGNWGVQGMQPRGKAVDQALKGMYARRGRYFCAFLMRLLHMVLQTLEPWLACLLLGFPVSLLEAALLRSLSTAASDALFVIPAGYGIQEASLILVGALLGLSLQEALALALCLRLKDFCVDLPGVLCWQQWEARQLKPRKIQSDETA